MTKYAAIACTTLVLVAVADLADLYGPSQVKVRHLEGSAAKAHLDAAIAKDADRRTRYEHNVQALLSRGARPTDRYFIYRQYREITPVQRFARLIVPPAFADGSESQGDTEMLWWDWSDGNDSTYEGLVYMIDYGDDVWLDASWELQINSSADYRVNWASGYTAAEGYSADRALRDWGECTLAACATAYTACWLSGPGWLHCGSAWCVGGAVGCGVNSVLSRIRHREP